MNKLISNQTTAEARDKNAERLARYNEKRVEIGLPPLEFIGHAEARSDFSLAARRMLIAGNALAATLAALNVGNPRIAEEALKALNHWELAVVGLQKAAIRQRS